jgi:hypothetical protein
MQRELPDLRDQLRTLVREVSGEDTWGGQP